MFNSEIRTIKSIKWNGEGIVEFDFGGMCWSGASRKDFWCPDKEWEKILMPGVRVRLWTVQLSTVVGFEYEAKNKVSCNWEDVWCAINNFQTKAQREASEKGYTDFIEKEGKVVAKLIDESLEPEAIVKSLDGKGHTGNTAFCAAYLGIKDAKNREAAEQLRLYWNKHHGATGEDKGGLVNPAILTIG